MEPEHVVIIGTKDGKDFPRKRWPEYSGSLCGSISGLPKFDPAIVGSTSGKQSGGSIFYFTDEQTAGIPGKAVEAAKGKDVRISGGAGVIQRFLDV